MVKRKKRTDPKRTRSGNRRRGRTMVLEKKNQQPGTVKEKKTCRPQKKQRGGGR